MVILRPMITGVADDVRGYRFIVVEMVRGCVWLDPKCRALELLFIKVQLTSKIIADQ